MNRTLFCRAHSAPKKIVSTPKSTPKHYLQQAIIHAKNICSSDLLTDEFECIAAWDTVDEIARGIAIRESRDPLEDYCLDNPDADECRVYDV